MPHIIVKRIDIPEGVLQVLDLKPNTSQRNLIYSPPPQSKYLTQVQRNQVALTVAGGVTSIGPETTGIEAWFGTNVGNGTPIQATGTITVGAPLAGDTITIGGVLLTGVGVPRTPGADDFDVTGGGAAVATDIAAAINDALNSFAGTVTATALGAVVTLTAVPIGLLGNAVTLVTDNPIELVLSGALLTGGSDESALTSAQMTANATAVLALIGYGSLTTAPGAVTLAAVNGALAVGSIVAGQLPSLLYVMEGREYVVPSRTIIDTAGVFGVSPAVGAAGGPGFTTGTFRFVQHTSSLAISFGLGVLSKYADPTFEYLGLGGTQGMAVVVLNDDGSLYV